MTNANPHTNYGSDSAPQQLVAGRFRLLEQIGSGRLGDIYRAEDLGRRELGIDERAAVQLLPDPVAENNSVVDKLELGYTVLRSSPHPGIVSYLDIGKDSQCVYVVMELLGGVSMRQVLQQTSILPLDEVIPVVRAVGDALQFLHSKSIVHGKVSPENVFVTDALDVKLLDVLPLSSSDAILRGVASQTPLNRALVQDDVFALACLVYEMLAGRHPFNYQELADVLKAGLEPEPIDGLAESQWSALRRTLVPNHDDSIRTIADFLKDFGISGTERLRHAQRDESSNDVQPPPRKSMVISTADLRPDSPKRTGRLRLATLLVGLIALGAWYVYGEPQDRLVALLESVPSASSTIDASLGTVAPPARLDPVPEELPETAAAVEPEMTEALAEPLPDPAPAETPVKSDFAFDGHVVTVSEQDAAARVTVKSSETPVEGVSWWVTGHTAIAGKDYVVLQGKLPDAQAGDADTTLLVPLVNDATAEPIEAFFVHLGRRDAPDGQLVPVDTVRVDIVDDD